MKRTKVRRINGKEDRGMKNVKKPRLASMQKGRNIFWKTLAFCFNFIIDLLFIINLMT